MDVVYDVRSIVFPILFKMFFLYFYTKELEHTLYLNFIPTELDYACYKAAKKTKRFLLRLLIYLFKLKLLDV